MDSFYNADARKMFIYLQAVFIFKLFRDKYNHHCILQYLEPNEKNDMRDVGTVVHILSVEKWRSLFLGRLWVKFSATEGHGHRVYYRLPGFFSRAHFVCFPEVCRAQS